MTKPIVNVEGFSFALIYVDDLETNLSFYKKYFGFTTKFTMENDSAHYGSLGKIDLWIGSGYEKQNLTSKSSRASLMIDIDSVGTLFNTLKEDGHEVLQDAPVDMGEMQEGIYWLQFKDPAGNILEVLGKK